MAVQKPVHRRRETRSVVEAPHKSVNARPGN